MPKLEFDKNIEKWVNAVDTFFSKSKPHCPYCHGDVEVTAACGADRVGFLAFTCSSCNKTGLFSRVTFPKDLEIQSF